MAGVFSKWALSRLLGLQIHSSGNIVHSIAPPQAKAASSWGLVQRQHAQLQCGDAVHFSLLKLFQSILISVIHECEVWGMQRPAEATAKQARSS